MIVCTITDASLANEKVVVSNEKESKRSQQGHIIVLAPADMMNRSEAVVHPITWSSTVIKRVCRSTLMAETFALIRGIEAGVKLRASIVDMKGQLDRNNWEESACEAMGHKWLTDCDSLYEHLMSSKFNSIENKRVAIDLMALRQQVWERNG